MKMKFNIALAQNCLIGELIHGKIPPYNCVLDNFVESTYCEEVSLYELGSNIASLSPTIL